MVSYYYYFQIFYFYTIIECACSFTNPGESCKKSMVSIFETLNTDFFSSHVNIDLNNIFFLKLLHILLDMSIKITNIRVLLLIRKTDLELIGRSGGKYI